MCGHNKAVRLLAELDTGKDGFGLIERVKQGQGRPAKIYVKKFTTTDVPETPLSAPISDFQDSEMQTSQKQTSRLPLLGSQDFPKREASYLDNIYPEFSYYCLMPVYARLGLTLTKRQNETQYDIMDA